jgi:hypothetical protein
VQVNLPSSVLSGRSPPAITFQSMMDFHPAEVDLLGCREAFYANGAGRIRDDDLETRAIRLGSNFALNRLVPALEEVEHGDKLLHGLSHQMAQLHTRTVYHFYFVLRGSGVERCR